MYGTWFLFLFSVARKGNTECGLGFKNKDKLALGQGDVKKLYQVFSSAYNNEMIATMEADWCLYLKWLIWGWSTV